MSVGHIKSSLSYFLVLDAFGGSFLFAFFYFCLMGLGGGNVWVNSKMFQKLEKLENLQQFREEKNK